MDVSTPNTMKSILFGLSIVLFSSVVQASDFGPFIASIYNFGECHDNPNPKIFFKVRQKKVDKQTFAYDINITNTIPINDELSALIKLSEMTSRGRYNDNSFAKEFPKVCSISKVMATPLFKVLAKEIKESTKEDLYTCNLAPGSRTLTNVLFPEGIKGLPKYFWYKKYILNYYFKKNQKSVGCLKVNVDILPKKNKHN